MDLNSAIAAYRKQIAENTKEPFAWADCCTWNRAMLFILTGETPSDEDFAFLMQSAQDRRGASNAGGRYDYGKVFWDIWFSLTNEDLASINKVTRFSELMAGYMVTGTPNAKLLIDVLKDGAYRVSALKLEPFVKVFPVHAKRLMDRIIMEKLACRLVTFTGLRSLLNSEDLKLMTPVSAPDLYWLVDAMGPELGDEYYCMASSLKDKGTFYSDCGDKEYSLAMLFDALPEPYYTWTVDNARTLFSTGVENFARQVLAAVKRPAKLVPAALKHLSRLKSPGLLTLGATLDVPDFSGKALCQLMVFLAYGIANPALINGIPSEEELRTRCVEVQIADAGLFDAAIEARDRLDQLTSGKDSFCKSLYAFLKELLDERDAGAKLIATIKSRGSGDEDSALLLACLYELRHVLKKYEYKWQYDTFDKVPWVEKPSEKQAERLMSILAETFPHIASACGNALTERKAAA